jgi:hypothetical protein
VRQLSPDVQLDGDLPEGAVILLVSAAWAQSDRSVSSVGVDGIWDAGATQGDVDLFVGERLRWTLREGASTDRLLVDASVTYDPVSPAPLERLNLVALGLERANESLVVDIGRHPVAWGGPRLVDGAQVIAREGDWHYGGWGGLAPDLFTTLPQLRYGGGPTVAWLQSSRQLSAVGEVLFADGAFDRAGLLVVGRVAEDPKVEATARLDLQATETAVGVADAQAVVRYRPRDGVRYDASYEAYSSYRYLSSSDLDPTLVRFAERIEALGIEQGIEQDQLDDTVYHQLGAGARWAPDASAHAAPTAAIRARARYAPDSEDRYGKLSGGLGLAGLARGRLEMGIDGSATVQGSPVPATVDFFGDIGVVATYEPHPDSAMLLDASVRLLTSPAGLSRYGDVYLSWLSDAERGPRLVLDVGVFGEAGDDQGFVDTAAGGFVRASLWATRMPEWDHTRADGAASTIRLP